jgi:hypothetical protein
MTHKVLAVAAIAALLDCGGEDVETTPIVAADEPTAQVVVQAPGPIEPAHGGTIVAVGEHPVEILANRGGEVRAYMRSPEPPPPERVRMTVRVPDEQGQRHPVLLVWNPAEAAYVGRARRVQIAPGAIDVALVVGDARYEASSPTYVIIDAAPRPAQVEVVEVQDEPNVVVVERPSRPVVVVERPQPPVVVVERPRPPVVVVERPRPPVVVVQPPRPGVVVVERRGKFKHRGRGHGRHGHVRIRH